MPVLLLLSLPAGKGSGDASGDATASGGLGPQWDCIQQLLEAMPKRLLAQAASQVRCSACLAVLCTV